MFFVPPQFDPISSSVQWSCMVEIQDQGMEVRMRAHHTSISFECVAAKQTNTSSTYYYTTYCAPSATGAAAASRDTNSQVVKIHRSVAASDLSCRAN